MEETTTYLNTAACGLVSEEIAAPGIDFLKSLKAESSRVSEFWRNTSVNIIRKNVADFVKAPEENIGLIPSFSYGMNSIVQSLKGTEKVLLYELDYPSLINPFLVNHFDISRIPDGDGFNIDPQQIAEKIKSEQINLLAISHVQWLSGARIDLKNIIAICHQHEVPVIVDATQSLGALPLFINELQPDVLISSNYKWMNAGFGTGIIYISDSFLKKYPPTMGGVWSFETSDGKMIRKPSVLDYEPGHRNMVGFSILDAAIKDKKARGLENIEKHNLQLTQQFIDACPSLSIRIIGEPNMENRSSIVVLKDEKGLGDWLTRHNFIATLRNETIRLSFHYYNTEEEVNRLISCLKSFKNN